MSRVGMLDLSRSTYNHLIAYQRTSVSELWPAGSEGVGRMCKGKVLDVRIHQLQAMP